MEKVYRFSDVVYMEKNEKGKWLKIIPLYDGNRPIGFNVLDLIKNITTRFNKLGDAEYFITSEIGL